MRRLPDDVPVRVDLAAIGKQAHSTLTIALIYDAVLVPRLLAIDSGGIGRRHHRFFGTNVRGWKSGRTG